MADLSALRKSLKEFWSIDRRNAVSSAYKAVEKRAFEDGDYAKCLQEAMNTGNAGRVAYATCAQQANLASKLHGVWGSSG